jgi:16S rRNA (cytidine1402-2'-O)-methyltransferase
MLTFVPTPLGNLRDVTLRALDELRDCDLIVAEDTRVARRLLSALDLPSKELLSYREHNADAVTELILARATNGRVVVVSDAGMPAISDPGSALVRAARSAGIGIEVLPGPCAFVTAAVLSGFDYDELVFAGFVPRRNAERVKIFSRALGTPGITTFYESPHRIVATLEAIATLAPDASLFLAREITKKFEQQIAGNAKDVLAALERPVRGEIVLIVAGAKDRLAADGPVRSLEAAIDAELAQGHAPSAIAKMLAREGLGGRASIYQIVVERTGAKRSRKT